MHPDDAAQLAQLYAQAQAAALLAYAPYSRFRVGAALLFDDGAVVTGCNVENASFGLTSCAERNALFRSVSERGASPRIVAIAVANANHASSPPCGACRQVLSEFVTPDALVVFPGQTGLALATVSFRSLLPHSFQFEAAL
ncbi:cytidine deaminase [Acidipila sp. EB88]|uniref:cytidine deaminase n=1 Tax=Acidipila sp. EB88 TaxID=2305226 RepID=UPI000F5E684C|nr:cytidine deaminase [Acidipila sp. EB88]RRA48748.1 cytidine deaminase [Acidipila sp. EB88]